MDTVLSFRQVDSRLQGRVKTTKVGKFTAQRAGVDCIELLVRRRGNSHRVALLYRNGRLEFVAPVNMVNRPVATGITELLPLDMAGLAKYSWFPPVWRSANPKVNWNQSVLIPYCPGDYVDLDSRYLYTSLRNNF